MQHAFVHSHPNFTPPQIPVPPLSIPDLLAPTKSSSLGGSPKSPHRRSFSPALKVRSPRGIISGRFSRPSSAASSITDQSSLAGSEEDLHKPEFSQSYEPTSALHLLAENFKKIEREKEKRTSARGSWANLGDKFKIAKRSSKKISSYAVSKIGEGQESFMRKFTRRKHKDRPSVRESLSDTEEDNLNTQSTPLLFSMSASTQNLSTAYLYPPPKPPRTFKTKNLQDLVSEYPDDDFEEEISFPEDDFSGDVFSAIKEVSKVFDNFANGHIPTTTSSLITRSESSPQLSHSRHNGDLTVKLQTISEDNVDGPHLNRMLSESRENSSSLPATPDDDRLVQSVPLRRKSIPIPPTNDDSDLSVPSTCPNSDVSDCIVSPKKHDDSTSDHEDVTNSRFSVLSTTSAEFYSAESSDGSSVSPSPDLLNPFMSPLQHKEADSNTRVLSSLSVDEEKFNTPPSSPNPMARVPTDCTTTLEPTCMEYNDSTATLRAGDMTQSEESNSTIHEDRSVSVTVVIGSSTLEPENQKSRNQELESDIIPCKEERDNTETSSELMTPTEQLTPVRIPKRLRSNTEPDNYGTLPIRGNKSQKERLSTIISKDDNFDTEFKGEKPSSSPGGMTSYFSEQDLKDIFKSSTNGTALPETVKESKEEGEDNEKKEKKDVEDNERKEKEKDGVRRKESTEEVRKEVREEVREGEVSKVEEMTEEQVDGELISAENISQTDTPEEPVVIPDTVTPTKVKGHNNHLHNYMDTNVVHFVLVLAGKCV